MQIVIDIDEGIAQGIIDGNNDEPRNIVRSFQATIADAIKNGKPLPKGHGQLIDISDIEPMSYTVDGGYYYDDYKAIDWEDIEKAPIIIEAEREEA